MPAQSKTLPSRPLIQHTTKELKELASRSLGSPQRLTTVYFELQFRQRKAAKELREYIRFLLASLGHPFPWPSTAVSPSHNALAQGVFEIDIGLLKTMGYRVGVEGIGEGKRRDILDDIYEQELGLLKGHPQEKDWGKPLTGQRLHKLARVIASFARLNKKKKNPPLIAISEWESDLNP